MPPCGSFGQGLLRQMGEDPATFTGEPACCLVLRVFRLTGNAEASGEPIDDRSLNQYCSALVLVAEDTHALGSVNWPFL